MKPNFPWNLAQRILAATLAAILCGVPAAVAQAAQQQTAAPQQQGTQAPPAQSDTQSRPQVQKQNQTLDVDPSKGPLQPITPSDNAAAPAGNAPQTTPPAAPQPQEQQQKATPAPAPQGVAVAGEAKTNGGPASEPAGTAIAPAKQRQMRSLLIKIGAIGAGAAALGAIYGLTRSTPSHP